MATVSAGDPQGIDDFLNGILNKVQDAGENVISSVVQSKIGQYLTPTPAAVGAATVAQPMTVSAPPPVALAAAPPADNSMIMLVGAAILIYLLVERR